MEWGTGIQPRALRRGRLIGLLATLSGVTRLFRIYAVPALIIIIIIIIIIFIIVIIIVIVKIGSGRAALLIGSGGPVSTVFRWQVALFRVILIMMIVVVMMMMVVVMLVLMMMTMTRSRESLGEDQSLVRRGSVRARRSQEKTDSGSLRR